MKKNLLLFISLGFFLTSVMSCKIEENASGGIVSDNVVKVSIEAIAPETDVQGKTTFDGETLVWTGNETMDVLVGDSSCGSVSSKTVKTALTIDPVTNKFVGTVNLGSFTENDIRAITVPGNSNSWIRYKSSSFRIRIPLKMHQVQQKDGVMNGDNFPLYAAITDDIRDACKQADGSYKFSNIQLQWGCAALRFNVYGTHPDMDANEVLKSVTVKFSSAYLQNFEAVLSNNELIKNVTTDEMTVSLTEGATIAGKTAVNGVKLFMAMFPYKNNISKITITTDKATYTMTETASAIKSFAGTDLRGNVYPLGLNISKFVRTDDYKLEYYKRQTLKIAKAANLPSLQVTYTKGDKISYSYAVVNEEFYKTAIKQEKSPISTSSIYHACSIGKVPMGYIAAKLMEEGKLDIDRKIVSYYDDPANNEVVNFFKDDGESRQNIQDVTVKEILLHTSGISNSFGWLGDTKNVVYSDSEVNSYRGKYRYSTNAIHVLDLLFGHIIGAPLQDYENTHIFDKCGMKTSSYIWISDYDELAVYGHHQGTTTYLTNSWTIADAGKSLFTSAEEYTKFLRWTLNGADFAGGKDSDYYKAMFAKYGVSGYDTDDGSRWRGLVWGCANQTGIGDIYLHSGSLGGFRGQMFILPDTDETFCCFTNATTELNYALAVSRLFLGQERDLDVLVEKGNFIEYESDTISEAGKFIIKEE